MAKTADLEVLFAEIEKQLAELGFSLVDLSWGTPFNRRTLTVYADKPGGLYIEDCQLLSSRISEMLDSKELVAGTYVLEVSSPGAERPLKKDRDFAYFKGRYVLVRTKAPLPEVGTTEIFGFLGDLTDSHLELNQEDGNRLLIPREQIAKARLAIKF